MLKRKREEDEEVRGEEAESEYKRVRSQYTSQYLQQASAWAGKWAGSQVGILLLLFAVSAPLEGPSISCLLLLMHPPSSTWRAGEAGEGAGPGSLHLPLPHLLP